MYKQEQDVQKAVSCAEAGISNRKCDEGFSSLMKKQKQTFGTVVRLSNGWYDEQKKYPIYIFNVMEKKY